MHLNNYNFQTQKGGLGLIKHKKNSLYLIKHKLLKGKLKNIITFQLKTQEKSYRSKL